MATHSSVLAWRIPGMGEPGGLPSMGWHRVRHDWSDLAAAATAAACIGEGNGNPLQWILQYSLQEHSSIHSKNTPVSLPGESCGQWSLGSHRVRHNWSNLACMHAWETEKAMAPHSSTLSWKIPWTEEPGRLPSMGSHRIGHDCSDLAAAAKLVTAFLSRSKCILISWCRHHLQWF